MTVEKLEERFHELTQRWRAERGPSSFSFELTAHPAYQEIISMGHAVLPHIFEEMARKPDHWFEALRVITGENPIPKEYAGNLPRMSEAWLDWARDHGYY